MTETQRRKAAIPLEEIPARETPDQRRERELWQFLLTKCGGNAELAGRAAMRMYVRSVRDKDAWKSARAAFLAADRFDRRAERKSFAPGKTGRPRKYQVSELAVLDDKVAAERRKHPALSERKALIRVLKRRGALPPAPQLKRLASAVNGYRRSRRDLARAVAADTLPRRTLRGSRY
jgi:hypothetical protein